MNPKEKSNEMQPYLKRYKMKITALGPIHVGDGKTFNKTGYLYDQKKNRVLVLDSMKVYSYLEQINKLEQLQDHLLGMGKEPDLFSFLQKESISEEIWEGWKSYDYSITVKGKNRLNEIHSFVKDAKGRPYVPGSSIKGMIRTALLAYLAGNGVEESAKDNCQFHYREKNEQELKSTLRGIAKEKVEKGKKGFRKEEGQLASLVFHQLQLESGNKIIDPSNAVCSIMRGLLVRDSQALSLENLDLAQKIDLFSENKREGYYRSSQIVRDNTNSISTFKEVLRPGTEIYFDLILDSTLFPYSLDTILKALDYFNEQCYHYHYCSFQRPPSEKGTVWLGGGAGFCTKTVTYPLLRDDSLEIVSELLMQNFQNHHHERDKELGISPRTTPIFYQGSQIYDHGMGRIEVVNA